MAEGKITLVGFDIDEAEKAIAKNLIANYRHKIEQKTEFQELMLRLKKSQHEKACLHEVHGKLVAGKIYNAKAEDYNLFSALSEVFEKLINELMHNQRTRRQER